MGNARRDLLSRRAVVELAGQALNAGLLIAEVELTSEDAAVPHPAWLGDEVTDDPRYLNARLSVEPYGLWRGGGRG